ncbi:MAG: hypothetical protein ACR2NX_05595, partial [Chthoniobacterales bacterium]
MKSTLVAPLSDSGRNKEYRSLTSLQGEVGQLLMKAESTAEVLQGCVEALVRNLDAAFARIWTYNAPEQMLELQVSAGLYTHLDGPHGRV